MTNFNDMTLKQLRALGKQQHVKDWWNLNKAALTVALAEIELKEMKENTLIETPPPEKIVAYVEVEEPKVKKPSLKIHELTFNGKTQTIKEWAKELEMPWPTLYDRVNRNGWTTEEALTIPLGGRRPKKHK